MTDIRDKKMPRRRRSPAPVEHKAERDMEIPGLLTGPLGLAGWNALDPVLLAALATAEPMLIVGRHGTAKSFLIERLAESLGLVYRFYNASLISFDDLVGIPVPTQDKRALEYISTPTAIWDAEVVFVDELNRTRPELQNKLFPIIHERRVQGVNLTKLRYRWAAINPPPTGNEGDDEELYLGAEPLDPALADRFAFLIEAPTWESLTDIERQDILLDQFRGRHEFPVSIARLIERTVGLYAELRVSCAKSLCSYILALVDLLNKPRPQLSTRRATMLLRNLLAIQAARVTLAEAAGADADARKIDWSTSAYLAIRHGHPGLAQTGHLDEAALLAAHRQAWKVAGMKAGDPWKRLLRIADPVGRLALALQLGRALPATDIGQLICDAVAAENNQARRTALAVAVYVAVKARQDVPAGAIELLARDARLVVVPVSRSMEVSMQGCNLFREVGCICSTLDGSTRLRDAYTRNLLQALLPDGYADIQPQAVKDYFETIWARLMPGAAAQPVAGEETAP
jgi:MoxR-like ATPase